MEVVATEAAREFLLDELASSLSEALGSEGPELMLELEEEVPSELELGPAELPKPPAADPEPAPARLEAEKGSGAPPGGPALTKFRSPPGEAPAAAPARREPEDRNETTQHALGRLKLVKRRRGRAAAGTEKPNPILRLLSSF